MQLNDTIELLKECDAGTKMAVSSIDEILNQVQEQKFKEMLIEFKDKHTNLGNEIHNLLMQQDEEDKEPTPIAKGMSWVKTNMKMMMDESDKTIADLITDGCNMGVKSLNRYLNQYVAADEKSKKICKDLISIEEDFAVSIKYFL
ncbi:hypothetical protein [Anaerovorax sp. IOR16]|uniref:hypothetical protein n=1 Tax=Anaerovorax sp. IOR16 TaxID=2773458 RepID=UPI0019CFDD86|nr:hypothetical protein [Anaerovorax sp. IOR16]